MKIADFARELKSAYERAPRDQKVVAIHLFGIRNADALQGISLSEVVAEAGINKPYATEIRKGMNLAKFVTAN